MNSAAATEPTERNVYLEGEIQVGLMFTESAYSRPLNGPMLRKLRQGWDRGKMGVVYLSMRSDGRFAILDGAHRVAACRDVEGVAATVPARVYLDLTIEDEAQLWDAFNRHRRPPTQLEMFKVRLAAGDHQALAIQRVARTHGMDIMLNSGRQKHAGELVAVAALDSAYKLIGPDGLSVVLDILKQAFPGDPRGFQAMTIKGLAMFWHRYGDIAIRSRVIDVLRKISALEMHSKANALRAVYIGINMESAWGRVLHSVYNKGLRTAQLPEWYDKTGPMPKRANRQNGRE